ncbi:MAG: alpha-amylase family glycosyl hydrolase [Lentisphaerota bacterium]
MEQPPEILINATIDDTHVIVVHFRRGIENTGNIKVWLEPELPVKDWSLSSPRDDARRQGYFLSGGLITFCFDPSVYGLNLKPSDRVVLAGNFNGWDSSGGNGRWVLRDDKGDGVYEVTTQLQGLRQPAAEKDLLYKFVVNGSQWLSPPPQAINAVSDGKGNSNLRIDPQTAGSAQLRLVTAEPVDLSKTWVVAMDGILDRTIRCMATPGAALDRITSQKDLGVTLDRTNRCTTYRLFAPRASGVELCLFEGPEYEVFKPKYKALEPVEKYPLWKDPADGVWEISLLGLDVGRYYSFRVAGPYGDGEGFNAKAQVGDPYARAAAAANFNTMVIDPDATNEWFTGWTDTNYVQAAPQDTVIYEMHVRDLTMHPSSGVNPRDQGKYAGLAASAGTGTGLDHLKDLGITTVELLPTAEFSNDPETYNWGYAPVFYFAPEGLYAREPLKGSQYCEFKTLVNDLHNRGLGVILDVVFNHVGSPNIFLLIDKKYYFRLNPDFSMSNFSACGNDVRTEAPMMRRLMVDNILYWMKEFHMDGFRFDLAELVDLETLMAVRDAARAVNPKVILISEPWSFRGENKHQLKGTGWSAWNNDFRYAAKDFAMGRRNRDWMKKNILGSVEIWTTTPLQSVNYLESHDDMALADELCIRPDRDGRNLQDMDAAANRIAATVLFTSLGMPMISEGQEFLRSKCGFLNTFDKGDEVNALRWTDRERPLAAEALAYYKELIHLRLSPEGAAFRVIRKPPANYYQWLMPANDQALGYIVNAPRIHEGASFAVLLNAGGDPVNFIVPFPAGQWRMIGNGHAINRQGLSDQEPVRGPVQRSIQVPGLSSFIFMNEL